MSALEAILRVVLKKSLNSQPIFLLFSLRFMTVGGNSPSRSARHIFVLQRMFPLNRK